MEYLQVFDENKKMLDEKVLREDKINLPDTRFFMIVLIFIENSEGKFLLQKTSKQKGSCIATTGGHVTYGDDGFKTALKEVREELGLSLTSDELKYADTFVYRNCYTEIYYVKKDIDINTLTLQEEEVESVNWYTIDEINKLIQNNELRKSNIKTFELLLDYKKTM